MRGAWGALAVIAALLAGGAARADVPPPMSSRTIALPSGPSAMKGLGESFSPNLSTGAGNFAVDLDLPPGRGRPSLSLQYTHGHGRSEVGASFHLPHLDVFRTRDKGIPAFTEADRFAVAGPDVNDELVLVDPNRRAYRLKNEGAFALFVRDPVADTWTIRFPDGRTALLGADPTSRQVSSRGTYRWYVSSVTDVSGNRTAYDYTTDGGYVYLSDVRYRLDSPGYEARVDLTYETRPDPFTDYGYGSAATCRRRLARIAASAACGAGCSRTVRTYKLTYEVNTQSFLKTITEYGEGGAPDVTKPPLTFSYVTASRAVGATVTMPEAVPLDLVATGRAQFDDVNGDGLPDLLVGAALGYTYYENTTGAAWSAPIALSRSPDVSLDDATNGALLVDVNGDGFRDVVRSTSAGYSYFPGGNVVGGKLTAFLPPVPLGAPPGAPMWRAAGARVADLNLDGRIDLLRADGVHSLVDLNLADAGGERLRETTDKDLPIDVANLFADPSLLMVDFNGDGVQDFVINEISFATTSRLRVFYGLGNGQYAPFVAVPAPKGNPADFVLGDVNDDGYVDIVKYSGQQLTYWLGAGDEKLAGPYGPQSLWAAPDRSDTLSVQLMDMDGSGSNDLVLLTGGNRVTYVSFFAAPFIGLLSKIDNGMGSVTEIHYRSSTSYAVDAKMAGTPWRTTLPRPVAVVSSTTSTDSLDKLGLPATVKQTDYEYVDGYYAGKERELRGFGLVRTIEHGDAHDETRVTETWMHLGIDPATGVDEEVLKGKPYRKVTKGADGAIYESEETSWSPRWLCAEDDPSLQGLLPTCASYPQKAAAKDSLVAFATQDWILKGIWEKTTTPRYTLDALTYDLWGHVAKRSRYGEVAFAAPRAVGDPIDLGAIDLFTGGDEVTVTTSYINDTSRWLLGLPAEEQTLDAKTAALLTSHRSYYDGPAYTGLPLGQATHGKVTRESRWLAEQGRWIDARRLTLDAFDMPTDALDADGNHTSYGYDTETHTFAAREATDVDGGLVIAFSAAYDAAQGTLVQSTDASGNVTHYSYDGLGRLVSVVDPDSTTDLPTATYGYTFGTSASPVSTIAERRLVDRGAGKYQLTWRYLDGAGDTRLTKTVGDHADGYVAGGFAQKSAMGAVALRYKDFTSASLGLELPPASDPYEETFHDAMGRPTQVFPMASVGSARTFTQTRYLPLEVQAFDEEDTSLGTWLYPAITRVDGLGRTRRITRFDDYAGADGTRARRELDWSYTYDALGNLLSWTDPAGNLREYSYDSLSRLHDVRDPNLGSVHEEHDDAGNLTSRTDGLGQKRTYFFGRGNRLAGMLVQGDAHGAADYAIQYHWDTARADGPLAAATNLAGRVAWVEWPTGTRDVTYDRLGRITSQIESLWDPARSPYDSQARDAFRADYTFNAAGWATHASLPGGRGFSWTYGERGKVLSLAGDRGGVSSPLVTSVDYDAEGEATRTAAANGTTACAWFDARSELAALAAGVTSPSACGGDPTSPIPGAFQQLTYSRAPSREIARITDVATTGALPRLDAEYGYDRLHELTSSRTARSSDTFAYDPLQNLVHRDSTAPAAGVAVGDFHYGEQGAGPGMVTSAGGATFAYDAVGQMKAYGGYALAFDAEGRLRTASKDGGETVRHYYDAAGERRITVIERPNAPPEVHRFVFDGYEIRAGEEVWSADAGRAAIEIRRAPGAADETFTTFADHLAGTSHVTDASGTIVGFQQYGPYGELIARIGDPALRGYAGGRNEPDEGPGLVRFGARFYAPGIGRWVSADAYVGDSPSNALAHPLESGLFAYAMNDPINRTDPTGQYVPEGHNKVLDTAFGPGSDHPVSKEMLAGMKAGSDFVDRDQSAVGAYQHGMRSPHFSVEYAQQLSRNWLNLSLDLADFFQKNGFGDEMVGRALGFGTHTLQDSTSPAHKDFAVWHDGWKDFFHRDHQGTYGDYGWLPIEPAHGMSETFPEHPNASELQRAVFLSQMHYDMWKRGERYEDAPPGATLHYIPPITILSLPKDMTGLNKGMQEDIVKAFNRMNRDLERAGYGARAKP